MVGIWRIDWRRWAPILATAVVALAIRLHDIAGQPYWLDELLTLRRAQLPLSELIADAFTNMHLPTYYVGVRLLLGLGDGPAALRVPSTLFGAATAGLAAAVAYRLAGAVAGWTAGLLVALSPLQVQFGQEARANALLGLLVMIALHGLMAIAADPAAASRRLNGPGAMRGAWLAYGLGTAGALAVLNSAVFWLAASAAALAYVAATAPHRRRLAVNAGIVLAVVLCLWLPWLPFLSEPVMRTAVTGFWIPKPTVDSVSATLAAVYLFRVADLLQFTLIPPNWPWAATGMATLLPALALFGAWRLRDRNREIVVLGLAILVLPVALLAISLTEPLFIPRYLLWSAVPFFILVSVGIARVTGAFGRVLAIVAVLLGAINLGATFDDERKPHWGSLVRYVASEAGPCDVIYLEGNVTHIVYELNERALDSSGRHVRRVGAVAEAAAANAAGWPVWAAVGRVAHGPQRSEESFLRSLVGVGNPAETIRFGRDVVLFRFEPASAAPFDAECRGRP
jgi:mannosyltransferase